MTCGINKIRMASVRSGKHQRTTKHQNFWTMSLFLGRIRDSKIHFKRKTCGWGRYEHLRSCLSLKFLQLIRSPWGPILSFHWDHQKKRFPAANWVCSINPPITTNLEISNTVLNVQLSCYTVVLCCPTMSSGHNPMLSFLINNLRKAITNWLLSR